MELGLQGKVVLVTGGSKGIGLACAASFAAEGARIAICSRSRDNIDKASAELDGVFGVVADLVDAVAAERAIDTVEDRVGPIDILVNSAGAAKRTPPDELSPLVWRRSVRRQVLLLHQCHRSPGEAHGQARERGHRQHHRRGRQGRLVKPSRRRIGQRRTDAGYSRARRDLRRQGRSRRRGQSQLDGDGPGGGGARGRRPDRQHPGR